MPQTTVNTNFAAHLAGRVAQSNMNKATHAISRASTGARIVRPADDAASFAIYQKMQSIIGKLTQATRNVDQASGMTQVAGGGLESAIAIVKRGKVLATEASSQTIDQDSRNLAEQEYAALFTADAEGKGATAGPTESSAGQNSALNAVVKAARFNGVPLLKGSTPGDTIKFFFQSGEKTSDLTITEFAGLYNVGVDADLGKANSFATDSGTKVLLSDGTGMEAATEIALNKTQIYVTGSDSFASINKAQLAQVALDDAMITMNESYAKVGSTQSQLQTLFDNNKVVIENLTAAAGSFYDADMSEEVTSVNKYQVLAQAALAMLSQANQQTQMYLKILP